MGEMAIGVLGSVGAHCSSKNITRTGEDARASRT
jgi:hypothetical protein